MARPKFKDRAMVMAVMVAVKMHYSMRDALSELARQRKVPISKLIRDGLAAYYKIPVK